jgi:hypothetical protein
MTDKALDNLWVTTDSTFRFKSNIGLPSKLVTVRKLIDKGDKVQGYISYFLPKDKKGKLIGKPKRVLVIQKAGRSTQEMIPAELVTPYYEHIIKNKNYYKSIGASDLITKAESRLASVDTGAIASNFVNDFGLNTNLVDEGSILNMPSPQQRYSGIRYDYTYSGTIDEEGGEKPTDGGEKPDDEGGEKPTDGTNTEIPNVVSAESMQKAYKSSGSKRPFRDWLYSEEGKGIVNELTKFVNVLVNPNASTSGGATGTKPSETPKDGTPKNEDEKKETKILGMSPITFGIVSLLTIAVTSFVAYKIIKSKNK